MSTWPLFLLLFSWLIRHKYISSLLYIKLYGTISNPKYSLAISYLGPSINYRDMNTHSSMWNSHCRQKVNSGPLKGLIKSYELVVNNNTDFFTCPSSPEISIIDLALISPELETLWIWEIPKEYPSLFDYELILVEWEDIETQRLGNKQAVISG